MLTRHLANCLLSGRSIWRALKRSIKSSEAAAEAEDHHHHNSSKNNNSKMLVLHDNASSSEQCSHSNVTLAANSSSGSGTEQQQQVPLRGCHEEEEEAAVNNGNSCCSSSNDQQHATAQSHGQQSAVVDVNYLEFVNQLYPDKEFKIPNPEENIPVPNCQKCHNDIICEQHENGNIAEILKLFNTQIYLTHSNVENEMARLAQIANQEFLSQIKPDIDDKSAIDMNFY